MSLQITLIRHGKAEKALPNHREHPLSSSGLCQALNRRIQLGHPQFDLVCHSGLVRTKQTALLVANSTFASMVQIPGLFWEEGDPRGEVIDRVCDKLGHACLGMYLIEVNTEIRSLMDEASTALFAEIKRVNPKKVLVVGHDVFTPALCKAIANKDEPFLSFMCEETEGFTITFDDNFEVTSIQMIKN